MEKLPDEILLQLFSYFDRNNLKTASHVCILWQSLIQGSSLMKKLKCSILQDKSKRVRIIDDLEGAKHQNLKIFNLNGLSNVTPEVKQHLYFESVKKLSLFGMKLSAESLRDFLSQFQSITHLSLDKIRFNRVDLDFPGIPIKVPKLQHLQITDCNDDSDIIGKSLKSLNFKTFKADGLCFDSFHLRDFLLKLSHLQELEVKKEAILFAKFYDRYPFELKKLTMGHMYERMLRSYVDLIVEYQRYLPNDRLIHFLLSQSESLKELTVHNCPAERMMKFIVSDLKLTKLTLGIAAMNGLQFDYYTFDEIVKNHHLKELILYGEINDENTLHDLIMCYPALVSLTFRNSNQDDEAKMQWIASYPNIRFCFETVEDEDFNCIEDVPFYITCQNIEETRVMVAEQEQSERRYKEIFEAEMREAISVELDKMSTKSGRNFRPRMG